MMSQEDHVRMAAIVAFIDVVMVLRDPYEDGHGKRSSVLAMDLAMQLHQPADFIELLKYATLLHDVGKLMMAESILNKPKLSESERTMVNSHAELGIKVISALRFDKAIEEAIHHHHENWNGTGYPDGLLREQISLAARIIRVVDSFDAMTSKRPYRLVAYSPERAIAEMDKESGILYDPTIINVFKRMMADA
jgi:putative nucleotidyltransferase with HDIG domain